MPVPTPVSPNTLTPGVYIQVNLIAGAASPGTGALRVALIGSKASTGNLIDDAEVRAGGGADTAGVAYGPGTPAHLAAKLLYRKHPTAQADFVAATAGAGVATLGVTVAGVPTSNQVVDCDVMGRTFEIAWLVGETANDIRDKIIAAINQRSDDLAVTAVSGGAGLVTINSKVTGNVGNDVIVQMKLRLPQTGTETVTGAVSPTKLAGGTTDPDFSTVLALLESVEYHYIVLCVSNADLENVASTNNVKRARTHVETFNTGLNAKLQQIIAGYTNAIASATATTVDSDSYGNVGFGQMPYCMNGRGLPSELGGREAGGRLAAVSVDPSANRIGELMDGYIGAKDKVSDTPTLAESELLLGSGVTLIGYTSQGIEVLVRPVTTHSQDSVGAPDRRLLDVQNVDAFYIIIRDIRDSLPQEFPNAKIVKDTVPGADPPPQGVIEERDVKGFVLSRLRFWQRQGVATRASIDEAVTSGTLIVQVNPSDPTQVDIVIPASIVPPLAKFGVTGNRVPV